MATKTPAVTEPALGSFVLYTGAKGTDKLALVVGNSTNFVAKDEVKEFDEYNEEEYVVQEARVLNEGELVLTIFSISGAFYTKKVARATGESVTGVWKPLA